MSIANNRRWVESIINSGTDPADMVPWIAAPGTQLTWPGDSWTVSMSFFRNTLAMIRAKRTEQAIAWWDSQTNPSIQWNIMGAVMEQVFRPQILSYGTFPNLAPGGQVEDIEDTLRKDPVADETILAHTSAGIGIGLTRSCGIKVRFNNIDDQDLDDIGYMALNLEVSIVPGDEEDPPDDVRGEVYIWNFCHNQQGVDIGWELFQDPGPYHTTDDFVNGQSDTGFAFLAPVQGDEDRHPGWYETRRTFENIFAWRGCEGNKTYVENGEMEIKIVLIRPTIDNEANPVSGFTAYFDLVQLIGTPEIAGEGPEGLMAQGADHDYSKSVDEYDLLAFTEDWKSGAPQADFDNDGDVDADDFAAFLKEYQSK